MNQAPTVDTKTRQFFALLWRGGEYRYWWGAFGKKKTSLWWKRGEPTPALLNSEHNMFFGVHPCSAIPPTNAAGEVKPSKSVRSQITYIAAISCFFAEFDAKHFGGKTQALAHIEQLQPPPSVIVDSGGGYHTYWLFAEPFILTTEEDRERAKRLQADWVKRVGSDDDAKDLARVLRVPGTQNFKPAYGPDFPTVSFITADFERLYSFEELTALVPAQPVASKPGDSRSRGNNITSTPVETPAATVDDSADFATIAEVAALLLRLSLDRRDSYTKWLELGMALRCLGHIGFYFWKKFSETSPKYKPGDCEEKWQTFKPGTPGSGLLNLDSLRRWACEDDPDGSTIAGDVVSRAEYDRVKAKLDDLEQRDIWQQQILYRQDLQPTEKGVIIGLGPIVAASRNLGGNAGRVPLDYQTAADVLKTSKTTIGRGVEAGERIGIWRRDPETAQSKKGNFDIHLMRLELQPDYDTPAVLPLVDIPKHGGARPNAGRKPKCPNGCPPSTGVLPRTIKQDICLGCGVVIHETIEDGPIIENNQDETGDVLALAGNQDETGTPQPKQLAAFNQDETGDTTISMAPTFVTHADELEPYVNPDQVRFVLNKLPTYGPDWARRHMDQVEGWDKWPAKVHHAIHKAEGLSQELVEPQSHGMRGTAVRA